MKTEHPDPRYDKYNTYRIREELIMKILTNLHRGKINNICFKKDSKGVPRIYQIDDSGKMIPLEDLRIIKELLLKNIHDIAKKLNSEYLDMLEFIINKIDLTWDSGMEKDIKEIKERCGNILVLLAIEEN